MEAGCADCLDSTDMRTAGEHLLQTDTSFVVTFTLNVKIGTYHEPGQIPPNGAIEDYPTDRRCAPFGTISG